MIRGGRKLSYTLICRGRCERVLEVSWTHREDSIHDLIIGGSHNHPTSATHEQQTCRAYPEHEGPVRAFENQIKEIYYSAGVLLRGSHMHGNVQDAS